MVPHLFFHFPDTRFMLEVPNGVVGLHIEPNMHGMSPDVVQVTLFRQRVAITRIGAVVAVVVVILLPLLLLLLLLLHYSFSFCSSYFFSPPYYGCHSFHSHHDHRC